MTKLISKKRYLFIVLLLLSALTFSVIIRYPFIPHERGSDSFAMQGYAQSISTFGYAKWTINPLSYFGLYPYSYPSGVPFLLCESSLITGLLGESNLLIISFICGILCCLFMFILINQMFNDWRIAIIGGIFYTLTPTVINLTTWTASTRDFFLVLLPFFVWLLIKFHAVRKNRGNSMPYLLSIVLLSVVFLTVHRASLFIFPIFIAYIIAVILEKLPAFDLLKTSKDKRKILKYSVGTALFVLLIFEIMVQYTDLIGFYTKIRWEMLKIFPGQNNYFDYLYNMGKTYTESIGFGIIFLPIGFAIVSFKAKKSFSDVFLLLCFFAALVIFIVPTYATLWIIPFACIFIGIGLIRLILYVWHWNKKIASFLIIGIIMSSEVSTELVISYWNSQSDVSKLQFYMDDTTYTAMVYTKYMTPTGTFVDTRYDTSDMLSTNGQPCLPYTDPMALVYGTVNGETLVVTPNTMDSILSGVITLYRAKITIYQKPDLAWRYLTIYYSDSTYTSMKQTYNIQYLVEYTNTNGKIVYSGNLYDSYLMTLTYKTKYIVFQTGDIAVWYL